MKASQSQFTNYASALFYALCFMLFVIFNSGLNLVLQYQNKQTGIELAKQLQIVDNTLITYLMSG